MLVNLTLGLCSIISLIAIPLLVLRNASVYRRIKRQLEASASGDAVSQLPWASMIGAEDSGIGGRRLTLPVAAVGLTGLALSLWGFCIIFDAIDAAVGPPDNPPAMPERTPEEIQQATQRMAFSRHALYGTFPFVLIAFGGALYWKYKSENRPDAAPDLLVKLFPLFGILQVGRIHLAVFGFQGRDRYRIVVCAQNLFSDHTVMRVNIDTVPELVSDLPPSAVCLSIFDSPVPAADQSRSVVFSMSVKTDGGSGTRVRFSERQALSSGRRDNAFALATALAGHGGEINLFRAGQPQPGLNFCNRQGQWQAVFIPLESNAPAPRFGGWETESLWEPRQRTRLEDVAQRIADVVEVPLQPSMSEA
jgi:hypothetical protein